MNQSGTDVAGRPPTPLALITGASAGIGRELARLAARDRYRPILTARREERLEELAAELRSRFGVDPVVVPEDLADPAAPDRLIQESERHGSLEVLVNNAGFGTYGPFAETPLDRTADMIRVNIGALTRLTRLALPGLMARGQGFILNVASTAAFQPGPYMAGYYASKAYVLSLSEALHEELDGTGVSVTALCPGPTRTEFHERAEIRADQVRLLETAAFMDADEVARIGWGALHAREAVVVPGVLNKAGALAPRVLPRSMVTSVVGWLQERRS